MPLSIQCLSFCFLLVTCCPLIPMQAIFGKGMGKYHFNLVPFLRATLVYYIFALGGIFLLSPQLKLPLEDIKGKTLLTGLILSTLVLLIEVAFLHGLHCWQKRQWIPLNLSFVGTTQKWSEIFYPLLIAFCEEMTYRFLWFQILLFQWHMPILVVLLISSFCYALNHLLMGKSIFYAKLLTGLIYGSIYYITGQLWLVVMAHVGGNLLVECLSRLQTKVKKVVK
ncbi:CPBP family intramembrane glutamic endopeptidase [Streptococcus porcinus]|uniref:CAAX amino terminal protease family protein n=2 Tax=Streptococcus porcinus TaxID=1340 RepID=A0A4V0GYH7_STRPO|nr:type II CAAX endopeptidase family protein [Streptococcus porcinus]EGJ26626.1 CAAX amino terminal protease family protein [Streptococcus porcinus str. Jelinkova 176]MBA2796206.1 CPBP family intramembrane metalloprotease [Streptococcus porcinus]SQG42668.1 CAAX amino terminal protease family protein [Streptococcus porcinus]VTT41691.1 CAAX amino terminal protease family protein [Streptococcus porcinus]VTT42792.1 CAAX amino terminal protease family protein [Streptococcus porcinus]